jgi:hypothetical protein
VSLPIPGRDGIPENAIIHGCGAWWTGNERSHCGGCHLTFSSLTSFEIHRRGLTCNEPAKVGLVARQAKFGDIWGQPGPDPERAERLAEQRAAA